MINKDAQREAGRNLFMQSVWWLANMLAGVAAFLLTPFIYGHSVVWIQRFTAANYGYGFEDLIAVVWFGLCGFIVFFIARASIGTAVIFGGLAIAVRFL